MIDLDSPVAVGARRPDQAGQAPRRSPRGSACAPSATCSTTSRAATSSTGELTKVDELHEGEMLTVVGEITESEPSHTYQDRRTHRHGLPARHHRSRPTAPRCGCRSSPRAKARRDWHAARLPVGRRGVFIGQVSTLPRRVAAHQPDRWPCSASTTRTPTRRSAPPSTRSRRLFPLYPLTKGVESWDLQRAIAFALTVVDEVPDPLPAGRARASTTCSTSTTALQLVHAPDTWEQVTAAQRRFRFDEALVTQLVLARRRAELAQLGGQARTGGGGLLAAFDERLPVHAHPRPAGDVGRDRGRPRAPPSDEPPAPGRGRLRQDPRRAAGDAPRRRLRRPGRAAGADRGARPAAPPLDHRDARRPRRRRHARRPRRRDAGRRC